MRGRDPHPLYQRPSRPEDGRHHSRRHRRAEPARLAKLEAQLNAAGMTLDNLVKITTILPNRGDLIAAREARSAVMGDRRPASTLIVGGLATRPGRSRSRASRWREGVTSPLYFWSTSAHPPLIGALGADRRCCTHRRYARAEQTRRAHLQPRSQRYALGKQSSKRDTD